METSSFTIPARRTLPRRSGRISRSTPRATACLKIVEAIAATPPTAEELERARQNLLTQIELQLNSSDRVGLQLSEWIGMGDWRLLFLHRDRLRKVSVDDARRVAAKYFKPSNRTVGMFIPTPQPDRVEIASEARPRLAPQGLQGRRRRRRRRSVRSLPEEHRIAHRTVSGRAG